jgi:hypothetical protein
VVVPHAGVEPALLSELDFESSASTNSANGAQGYKISAAWIYTKVFAAVNHHFQRKHVAQNCAVIFRQRHARKREHEVRQAIPGDRDAAWRGNNHESVQT